MDESIVSLDVGPHERRRYGTHWWSCLEGRRDRCGVEQRRRARDDGAGCRQARRLGLVGAAQALELDARVRRSPHPPTTTTRTLRLLYDPSITHSIYLSLSLSRARWIEQLVLVEEQRACVDLHAADRRPQQLARGRGHVARARYQVRLAVALRQVPEAQDHRAHEPRVARQRHAHVPLDPRV